MTVTIVFNTKPGTISYNVFVSSVLPQMITVIAPTIIPESAPTAVIFLQYKVNKMIGPNEAPNPAHARSEEHTSELQSRFDLVCRLLLEKKNKKPMRRHDSK